jgi:hypothetical protein
MKTRKKIFIVVLMLLISITSFFRVIGIENIKSIQFFSIFVIGFISGILFKLLIEAYKNK